MLEAVGIDVYYGDTHVLRNAGLKIVPGQVVGLMGRNGVGKTTFLKSLIGLLPVRAGRMEFQGKDIRREAPYRRARRGIGYVPQGREIISGLTVEDNLRVGLEAVGKIGGAIPDFVFELFPVLKTMLNRRGGDLSGGQQQQLAIARALVSRPSLLLLDEPTEGIQPSVIREITGVIRKLKDEGRVSILLVEQYVAFVRETADYFYIMEKGSMGVEGPIEELTEAIIHRHLSI